MELIAAARILWSRRRLVIAGFFVSVAVGVVMIYNVTPGLPPKVQSKDHVVGQGSAQVLVDTAQSQIASSAAATDPGSIYARANELADLMASGPSQQAIASQLGISPAQLEVTPPPTSIVVPIRSTPLAVAGQNLGPGAASWRLAVVVDPQLPIVAFNTVAPDPQDAQRLATAAIAVLRQTIATNATASQIPSKERLFVNVIGPPVGQSATVGPRTTYGIAAMLAVFASICLGVVVVTARRSRVTEPVPQPIEAQLELPANQFARQITVSHSERVVESVRQPDDRRAVPPANQHTVSAAAARVAELLDGVISQPEHSDEPATPEPLVKRVRASRTKT